MKQYKKYLLRFLFLVFACIFLVSTFNIIIDPFGVWKIYCHQGINFNHTGREKYERLGKSIDIIQQRPEILFVGSSRIRAALDPMDYKMDRGDSHIYNAGIAGANMYEIRRIVEHGIANQSNMQEVVVGIDFFAFNHMIHQKDGFDDKQWGKAYITANTYQKIIFSLETLSESSSCLVSNRENGYDYDGYDLNEEDINGKQNEQALRNNYESYKNFTDFIKALNTFIDRKGYYSGYSISGDRMEDFRFIVDLCKERKIRLKVFLNPLSASQMTAISITGNWDNFEQLKKELVRIIPVYDFTGYNEITSEKFSLNRKYYWDASHYKKVVGNAILARINEKKLQGEWENFGVLLNAGNIEEHLLLIRNQRDDWNAKNSETVQTIIRMREQLIDAK